MSPCAMAGISTWVVFVWRAAFGLCFIAVMAVMAGCAEPSNADQVDFSQGSKPCAKGSSENQPLVLYGAHVFRASQPTQCNPFPNSILQWSRNACPEPGTRSLDGSAVLRRVDGFYYAVRRANARTASNEMRFPNLVLTQQTNVSEFMPALGLILAWREFGSRSWSAVENAMRTDRMMSIVEQTRLREVLRAKFTEIENDFLSVKVETLARFATDPDARRQWAKAKLKGISTPLGQCLFKTVKCLPNLENGWVFVSTRVAASEGKYWVENACNPITNAVRGARTFNEEPSRADEWSYGCDAVELWRPGIPPTDPIIANWVDTLALRDQTKKEPQGRTYLRQGYGLRRYPYAGSSNGADIWISRGGLRFNRAARTLSDNLPSLEHILLHASPEGTDAELRDYSWFTDTDGSLLGPEAILDLIDEAWLRVTVGLDVPQPDEQNIGGESFTVNMDRTIGMVQVRNSADVQEGTRIRLVVDVGGNLRTAYPRPPAKR